MLSKAGTVPRGWLEALFAAAQLGDLATALLVARELNPIAAAVMAQPLIGLAVKVGLIVFVIAVARLCDGQRPWLARLLLVFGTLAGLFGAMSNTHLTPFLGQ